MPVVALEYIEIDDRGVAKLIGSRIKVMHLVACQRVNGWSAEQLRDEFPHLSASQVYAALAYYHAHKEDIDRQIEEGRRFAEEMRAKFPNKLTREDWIARWKERYPGRPVPSADDPEGG